MLKRRIGSGIRAAAPLLAALLKISACLVALKNYIPRYTRLTYIADGLTRANLAYDVAHNPFQLFPDHQWPPLILWLWGGVLKVWPDIYWSGTALAVLADAGTVFFAYLIARKLAGDVAAAAAAVLLIFSPVHHYLTLGVGMSEPFFFCCAAGGVYFAARCAAGEKGAAAASSFLAAAALFRYEGALLLIAFSVFRLVAKRPATAAAWVAWALPLVVVGVLLGQKAFPQAGKGLWPSLSGVKADGEIVLPGSNALRRFLYIFERLWFDGRVAAVAGLLGAVPVWFKRYRSPARVMIAAGAAATLGAVGGVIVIHGTGFCPERHMAVVLVLLFPFAAFAARAAWDSARRVPAKVVVVVVVAAALAYQAYFDRCLKDYGYGYGGPCFTCHTLDAEVAVKFRELWRTGEMRPEEWVYMELNDGNWANLGIGAFSDHPRNFYIASADEVRDDVPKLPAVLKRNGIRMAIFVNDKTRAALKPYYAAYKNDYLVIYELPAHTVIVKAEGWPRGTPTFESRFIPEKCRTLGKR